MKKMNEKVYGEESGVRRLSKSFMLAILVLALFFPVMDAQAAALNKKTATICVTGTVKLKVTGTKKKVVWKSSNKKVATVSSTGKVTGKKKGTATITAKVGGKSYKCKVTVKAPVKINSSKAVIKSAACNNTKTATITWKKVKNATGYKIYRSTSKNGKYKRIKTITNGNTLKFTNKGLKGGRSYYYKVRAYRKNGTTYSYSKYSTAKKVYVYRYKKELIRNKVVKHYMNEWKPRGKYVSFDFDDYEDEYYYVFILRYQMSDEEAEERIEMGGVPSANVYVTTVWVDKKSGIVTDEWDEQWKMTLPK